MQEIYLSKYVFDCRLQTALQTSVTEYRKPLRELGCRTRGRGGGTHAPSYLCRSVITLSQPRGQIGLCPTHYCSPSPIFSDLPTSLEKINFYGLYICMLCLNIRVCVRPFFQICINFKGNLLKTRSLNYKLCLFVLLKIL